MINARQREFSKYTNQTENKCKALSLRCKHIRTASTKPKQKKTHRKQMS